MFHVENASAHKDKRAPHIRKYQKLSPMTYIKLDSNKHTLAIIIVVLFHNLSPMIPAGI
ncbi:MAG: hypothetical protein WCG25_08990 [bacterium]